MTNKKYANTGCNSQSAHSEHVETHFADPHRFLNVVLQDWHAVFRAFRAQHTAAVATGSKRMVDGKYLYFVRFYSTYLP